MANSIRMADNLCVRVMLQQKPGAACVINVDMSQEYVVYFLDPTPCKGIQKNGNGRSRAGIHNDSTIAADKYPAADKIPKSLRGLIQINQIKILHGLMYCHVRHNTQGTKAKAKSFSNQYAGYNLR